MPEIGDCLEESGWKQGSVVKSTDLASLLKFSNFPHKEDLVLLVASQSCDISHGNIALDPYVEMSLARTISAKTGNYTNNKNPRILHTFITSFSEEKNKIYVNKDIELIAHKRFSVPKEELVKYKPDSNQDLEDSELEGYVAWLAARYSRPALPTKFNDLISESDPKGKLRKKVKKFSRELSGIYVEIIPNREIKDGEKYRVNLLGLLSPQFNGNLEQVETAIEQYATVMKNAGMDVNHSVKKEDEISIAVIRRFKRFYYDDLSFKEDFPLPIETKTII